MKTTIVKLSLIMALALAFTASAQAQTALNFKTFSVPFSFNIGKKVLPAGEYKITADNQIIRIQKTDGKVNAIAMSQRTHTDNRVESDAKLTFRRYGDQYYLSQVWLPNDLGRELKRQRREDTGVAQNFSVIEIPALGR